MSHPGYGPGIAVITLPGTAPYEPSSNSSNANSASSNPKKPFRDNGNALSPTAGLELAKAISAADADDSVLAIVIRANGRYFCTGMDLSKAQPNEQQQVEETFSASAGNAGNSGNSSGGNSGPEILFECIAKASKPVICAMQGPALGGGTGILFACDIRICTAGSYIQFPEVTRGLAPALIAAYIVPQLGLFQAKQLMLRGSARVPVEELYRLGAITAVATPNTIAGASNVIAPEVATDLDSLVRRTCDELRASAPEAMAMTKALCARVALDCDSHAARLAASKEVFAKMITSEEAAYGIGMFLQKQKPDWAAFHAERKREQALEQQQEQEELLKKEQQEQQGEEDAVRAKL